MRRLTWLGVALAVSLGFSTIPWTNSWTNRSSAQAVELRDGQIYFIRPPALVGAITTHNSVFFRRPSYYFTLDVPTDAGEPLGQVVINQKDGGTAARRVRYRLDATEAFLGTRGDRGESLSLGTTTFDRDNQTVTVRFDPPVPPGNTVTIRLRPERNPRLGGVYLFGVTAYPAGETPYGQFLGYGRFNIYERDYLPVPFF
jgi:hypothetical protein